ncbi:MAG: GlsB/YeaQ/YmgE family stress response membrane protein [Acidimicrobiales bacterium]|nr:GlsB/YeaQ/YmgE family stress response membrane protein [Acidimicrobiales bacterium]HRW36403.1 GlsB/YeaQ/YmgE family stress response membrane protein [Aquihabitans sp.]
MWFVITVLFSGFVAGLVARALISGPSPRGCLPTTALGIVGSLIGGLLGYLLFGKDLDEGAFQLSGFFGSVLGAVLVLLVYRRRAAR